MIDFTFHFTESTDEEKQFLDSKIKSQAPSNSYIRYFTADAGTTVELRRLS